MNINIYYLTLLLLYTLNINYIANNDASKNIKKNRRKDIVYRIDSGVCFHKFIDEYSAYAKKNNQFLSTYSKYSQVEYYQLCSSYLLNTDIIVDGCGLIIYNTKTCKSHWGRVSGFEHPLYTNKSELYKFKCLKSVISDNPTKFYTLTEFAENNRKICAINSDGTLSCEEKICLKK